MDYSILEYRFHSSAMEKTIYSKEYRVFLDLFRKTRLRLRLSQEELAKKLGVTQSFISKCERGERRIDVIELLRICDAMEIRAEDFIKTLFKQTSVKAENGPKS